MNNVVPITALSKSAYSPQQITLIKNTVAKDTNNSEFDLFITVAQRAGLDPFRKQISAIVFNKGDDAKRQMAIITGIDGLRTIAARSGRYRPDEDEPEFTYDPELKGPSNPLGLVKAKVRIWIADSQGKWNPVTGVAYWEEYAPIKEMASEGYDWVDTGDVWPDTGKPKKKKVPREGSVVVRTLDPSGNWPKMPRVMLAKCFDAETEVLTAQGFQRFAEVTAPIMQVTAHGLEPVGSVPFRQGYSGPMVSLDSDDLNFCVTPNHDMVTTDGKIEAGELYERARARAMFFIPRHPPSNHIDAPISDTAIVLSAAYLADGYDSGKSRFAIAVSRPKKVARLMELGAHFSVVVQEDAGRTASTPTRDIVTLSDKSRFRYEMESMEGLCASGKVVDLSLLTSMSRRQAKLFVDTLVAFDGHAQIKSGVRRFYSSRPDIMGAFEVAAVIAGYAVSDRKSRTSDISDRPNLFVTISDRDAIGVRRWGRDYHGIDHKGSRDHTGLELTTNDSGAVWCVTVPSGSIVVRRHGFSMICGNCAESQALRRGFPEDLSSLYEGSELDRAAAESSPSELVEQVAIGDRLARIGGVDGILMQFDPNEPLQHIKLGQMHDRISEFARDCGSTAKLEWFKSVNVHPMREFWARAKADALAVNKVLELRRAELVKAEAEDQGAA